MAVTSGSGSSDSPAKVSPMPAVPNRPRQTWAEIERWISPVINSPRNVSQSAITGIAQNERKNTA